MSNLEKIIKVMSTLEGEKQKLMVDFKGISLVSPRSAREKAEHIFESLPYTEQMRVWYAVGDEDVSFENINMLSTEAKLALIQQLIVEDCAPETLNEIEARFCAKYMVDSDQEEKLKEEEAEEYSDDQSIVDAIKESYGEEEE